MKKTQMDDSLRTGISFGLTSAGITHYVGDWVSTMGA